MSEDNGPLEPLLPVIEAVPAIVDDARTLLLQVRRTLRFVFIVLVVFLIVIEIQTNRTSHSISTTETNIENVKTAATEARVAARKASDDLSKAIASAQNGGGINPAAVVAAFQEIHSTLILVQNLDAYLKNTGGNP